MFLHGRWTWALAAIGLVGAAVALSQRLDRGTARTVPTMYLLADAIERFADDTARLPQHLGELQASEAPGFRGPYVQDGPVLDPWGRPFGYSGAGGRFELVSYGADGRRGGWGESADQRVTFARRSR